jgi:hypothetical protein
MSEESKNIGKKDEQTEQEVKPAELSEQELDKVAGGGANTPINNVGIGLGSKSNPSKNAGS